MRGNPSLRLNEVEDDIPCLPSSQQGKNDIIRHEKNFKNLSNGNPSKAKDQTDSCRVSAERSEPKGTLYSVAALEFVATRGVLGGKLSGLLSPC